MAKMKVNYKIISGIMLLSLLISLIYIYNVKSELKDFKVLFNEQVDELLKQDKIIFENNKTVLRLEACSDMFNAVCRIAEIENDMLEDMGIPLYGDGEYCNKRETWEVSKGL